MITQPMQENERLPGRSQECSFWINPSPTLLPHERVEIYHQQYWWRLLKCLQENFPFVTCLLGYKDFNHQIAIPYLTKCPPTHWALCTLGESLPSWIDKNYKKNNSQLIKNASRIDWAANKSFWTKEFPSIDFSSLTREEILSCPIYLQPHITLFALSEDFFLFRDTLLKEDPAYWTCHSLPKLKKEKKYFIVYRSKNHSVAWKEITFGEYFLLSLFNRGLTIKLACEKIEETGGELHEEALVTMPLWFVEWTKEGWLTR